MSIRRSIWAVVAAAVTITGSAIPGQGDDPREFRYSGTVVAVDQGAGTMIVEGMGPWRVKDGITQLERRTLGVAPGRSSYGSSVRRGPLRAAEPGGP